MLRTCQTFECLVHVGRVFLDSRCKSLPSRKKIQTPTVWMSSFKNLHIWNSKYYYKNTIVYSEINIYTIFFLRSRVTYRWQSLYPLDGCETNHLHWARSFFSNLSLGYNLIEWFLLLLFICRRKKNWNWEIVIFDTRILTT